MKKSLLLFSFISASALAGVSFSCSEQLQDAEAWFSGGCSEFTLAEVKRAFEADWARVSQTRVDEGFDDDKVLDPGWIVPEWNAIEFCNGGSDTSVIQAEIPFEARYEYRLQRWDDEGWSGFSSMPSRLVMLKRTDTGETASWLLFLIPDADNGLSDGRGGFSGVALYATLAGIPVCAGRYDGGRLVGSASLLDESHSWEENACKLAELLPQDVHVARIRPAVTTRGRHDIDGGCIDIVVIEGKASVKNPDPSLSDDLDFPVVDPSLDDECRSAVFTIGEAGGGGSAMQRYSKNSKIKADKKLIDLLDDLYADCMGKRLINSITVNVNIQSANRTGGEANTYVNTNGIVEGASISLGQPMTDWTLMEELIHVYQNINGGCYDAKLNKEVEAKLGWYAYMKRIGNLDDPSKFLGGQNGERYFDTMYGFLLKKDMKNPGFLQAFENAAGLLRNANGYKNERFDPNKMDCANLLDLLKDCDYI